MIYTLKGRIRRLDAEIKGKEDRMKRMKNELVRLNADIKRRKAAIKAAEREITQREKRG